jgi:peptidoglycan/xylan/chitin deacetylase (PgdA/CDA1 family)
MLPDIQGIYPQTGTMNAADFTARLDDQQVAIFLFHGVVTASPYAVRNYTRKNLEVAVFRSIIRALIDTGGCPVSMDEVLQSCETGRPYAPKSFAVTFDDGFRNNLTVAEPVLRELGVPATFYITSGFVDANRMSWIDRIEFAVEHMTRSSVHLSWETEARPCANVEQRRLLLTEIRREAKSRPGYNLEALATDIIQRLGAADATSSTEPIDQKLNWNEVRKLASLPHCIVGGHSHSHAILSFLDRAALEQEVDLSLSMLRDKAGVVATHYSYPEGLSHCYSDEVIAVLKDRGVRCCPTAEDGLNPPGADPFRLKRILVA